MDSTFHDFPEVEEGGSRPPKTPEMNPPCLNPPSPRPNFNFLATMAANRTWLATDVVVVPFIQHPFLNVVGYFSPNYKLEGKTYIDQSHK